MEIVVEIVQGLTSGLVEMAEGIGAGLVALVQQVFLDNTGDTTKLSTFGVVIVAFGGVSLAVGLSTLVVKWVMSLGARN